MVLGSAIVVSLLSVFIIALEVSLYLDWSDESIYAKWTDWNDSDNDTNFFAANLICIIPLSYIGASSYFGLFRIKI